MYAEVHIREGHNAFLSTFYAILTGLEIRSFYSIPGLSMTVNGIYTYKQ